MLVNWPVNMHLAEWPALLRRRFARFALVPTPFFPLWTDGPALLELLIRKARARGRRA